MATATLPKPTKQAYQVGHPNDWCPGCGDFGTLNTVQQALAALHLLPHQVAIFGGIGCSGKTGASCGGIGSPGGLGRFHPAHPQV